MKKLLIFLMASTLFIACNNDKGGGKKADYRDKDDYSNTDSKDKDDNTGDDDKQGKDKSEKNDDDQNDVTSNDGWSESDNNKFTAECMTGFGNQQAIGKQVCPCALEKFQKKYNSYAEVQAKSSEAEGNRIGKQCAEELNINISSNKDNNTTDNNQEDYSNAGWSSSEVKKFVGDCMRTAQAGGMEELDAQSYCDCMQDKLSKIYPSFKEANKLTTADLSTPSMKRMVKSCLPGN